MNKQALATLLLAWSALASSASPPVEADVEKDVNNAKSLIHGLKFTLEDHGDERNMEWKPKIGIVGLANLGADFRTPDQKTPKKARRPSPEVLFPFIAPLLKKSEKEDTVAAGGSPGLLDGMRFFKGGGGGGGGVDGPLTCMNQTSMMNATFPCGQCQMSNGLVARYISSNGLGYCVDLKQCVDMETGDCADATSACFASACAENQTFGTIENELVCYVDYAAGRCSNARSDICVSVPNNESEPELCGIPGMVDGKLTCQSVPITKITACGVCQTKEDLVYQYFDRNYTQYCLVGQDCEDIGTGVCAGDAATQQCFSVGDRCPYAEYSAALGAALHPGMADKCLVNAVEGDCNGETDYCVSVNTTGSSTFQSCVDDVNIQRQLQESYFLPEAVSSNDGLYVGFVRVPKTGSSTLLKFLQKSRRLFQWNLFVSDGKEDEAEDSEHQNSKKPIVPTQNGPAGAAGNCVFGIARSKSEVSFNQQTWWNSCVHVTFGQLVKSWTDSLALWKPLKDTQDSVTYEKTLNVFTMVRDPFSRLVSYFYYLRKFSYTNNFLMNTVTMTQYKFVEDNDLEGWLHQMHIENGGRGLNLPYQYKYVHEDVDEAIKLIKNDANPQVYTLLTECYEVSLRLMAENFVGFRQGEVDKFIESDDYETNNNKALYSEKPDKETLSAIRAKAEVWFADDFKFFDVAVEQFIEKMETSGLSEEALKTCKYWKGEATLDQEEA